jgi:hypothetical protein
MNICEVPFAPVKSSSVHAYSIVKKMYDSEQPIHSWVRYDKINENGGVIVPMSKGVSYNIQYNETDNLSISRYKLSGLNNDDLMAVAHNLNLKLYKFLRWVVRSGPALAGNFKSIPIPTTVLNDVELYTLFNLTDGEIAHIESNVK